jgi:hypothetical protein
MKHLSLLLILITATLPLLTACHTDNPSKYQNGYTYSGIYFGKNISSFYKQGIRDGCSTAKGIYTKSHILFKQEADYYKGWFLGRNRCKDQYIPEV